METARYRPPEALHWLDVGAQRYLSAARRGGSKLARREEPTFGKVLMQAAGALLDTGKSALAQVTRAQAAAVEYILREDGFEVNSYTGRRWFAYQTVQEISLRGDRATIKFEDGSIVIKPLATISTGSIKVPIGWVRNGLEVPYDTLLDELSARCQVNLRHE